MCKGKLVIGGYKVENRGVVLAQTLILITIIAIIAGTLLMLSQGDLLLSRGSEESLTEFYIEQAAIEIALAEYTRTYDGTTGTQIASTTISSGDNVYTIDLDWYTGVSTYTISADVQ